MWVNFVAIIAIVAQGQFEFVIDPSAQMAILGVLNIILRAVTGEDLSWDSNA
jgi:hypothetical protein